MSAMTKDLLIELFSEEIPARMQVKAADDLKRLLTNGVVEAGLTYKDAAAFVTPRRLTLTIEGLSGKSLAQKQERKGPSVTAPQKAIDGFLRSTGLSLDELEIREEKKGPVYFAVSEIPGREASQIVAEVLEASIRAFPWPKSMRWGTGSLRWVRPLQSIVCLLNDESGAQVVPFELEGIEASDVTYGHRFMAPDAIKVTSFDDCETKLKRAKVMLRSQERADVIWNDATNQAFALGLEVIEDPGLLAELAGLVEWPVPLMGVIDESFLELPPEVLQTSMKEHQKFFSVKNAQSGRIERFVTVANIEASDQGQTILAGNQKVLFARLSDAKFFWENDVRVATSGLDVWRDGLKAVTFQRQLGSQFDRVERIEALAGAVTPFTGADASLTQQAASLCKVDLRSEMVYEFPELQGLMGQYYVKTAGYEDAVAQAALMHWKPLGPSDEVPTHAVSISVALADKLDTLAGFWSIGEMPTGSKDPFALRRSALGVIRILLENEISLPLLKMIEIAHKGADSVHLLAFFHDRLKVYLRDQNIRHDVIDACIAMPGNDDLLLLTRRAKALNNALGTQDGVNLIQGFKRANNIVTQAQDKDGVEYSFGADATYMTDESEQVLLDAVTHAKTDIMAALQAQDFETAVSLMARLRAPLDGFFTQVQVNTDQSVVRRNRLNLLDQVRQICLSVADLTKIEG